MPSAATRHITLHLSSKLIHLSYTKNEMTHISWVYVWRITQGTCICIQFINMLNVTDVLMYGRSTMSRTLTLSQTLEFVVTVFMHNNHSKVDPCWWEYHVECDVIHKQRSQYVWKATNPSVRLMCPTHGESTRVSEWGVGADDTEVLIVVWYIVYSKQPEVTEQTTITSHQCSASCIGPRYVWWSIGTCSYCVLLLGLSSTKNPVAYYDLC